MSVDLVNEQGHTWGTGNLTWQKVLWLAYQYGWEPAGTKDPEGWVGEWHGNYSTNSGQIVAAEDARALANALERAFWRGPRTFVGLACCQCPSR